MGVWGNHSPTMYPDLFHAQGSRRAGRRRRRRPGVDRERVPAERRQTRRGDHRGARLLQRRLGRERRDRPRHDWVTGTDGDWVSMGVPSDGSYGVPEGLISGFPCTCADGEYSIVAGPRARRLLTREDRRLGRRADRRARHGQRAGLDLVRLARSEHARAPRSARPRAWRSSAGAIFIAAGLVKFVFHHWELHAFGEFGLPSPFGSGAASQVCSRQSGGVLLIATPQVVPICSAALRTMLVAIGASGHRPRQMSSRASRSRPRCSWRCSFLLARALRPRTRPSGQAKTPPRSERKGRGPSRALSPTSVM